MAGNGIEPLKTSKGAGGSSDTHKHGVGMQGLPCSLQMSDPKKSYKGMQSCHAWPDEILHEVPSAGDEGLAR